MEEALKVQSVHTTHIYIIHCIQWKRPCSYTWTSKLFKEGYNFVFKTALRCIKNKLANYMKGTGNNVDFYVGDH